MNQGMTFLVSQVNMKRLTTQIAIQCAPVIMGIKISNLLIVDSIYTNAVKVTFYNTKLSCRLLCRNNKKVVFLIYYPLSLRNYLREESVYELMQCFGYNTKGLSQILDEFSHRYVFFMKTKRKFPHELGLLLGYPSNDVKGFIKFKGKNYIYSGYWKVYERPETARRTFARYEKAKMVLLSWVLQGGSIRDVLTLVEKNAK